MRIFLDTADIDEIREVARWGILSGVTTNPTLLSKNAGKRHEDIVKEIAELSRWADQRRDREPGYRGHAGEARRFAAWHPNVVVKVPSTPEWLGGGQAVEARGDSHECDALLQRQSGALRGARWRLHHQPVRWPARRYF